MGIDRMKGTPWHAERVHREEGDERRYKGRCKYYIYEGNKCILRSHCMGSAHCPEYEAISEAEFKKRQNNLKKKKTSSSDDDVYWY